MCLCLRASGAAAFASYSRSDVASARGPRLWSASLTVSVCFREGETPFERLWADKVHFYYPAGTDRG